MSARNGHAGDRPALGRGRQLDAPAREACPSAIIAGELGTWGQDLGAGHVGHEGHRLLSGQSGHARPTRSASPEDRTLLPRKGRRTAVPVVSSGRAAVRPPAPRRGRPPRVSAQAMARREQFGGGAYRPAWATGQAVRAGQGAARLIQLRGGHQGNQPQAECVAAVNG